MTDDWQTELDGPGSADDRYGPRPGMEQGAVRDEPTPSFVEVQRRIADLRSENERLRALLREAPEHVVRSEGRNRYADRCCAGEQLQNAYPYGDPSGLPERIEAALAADPTPEGPNR